MDQPQTRKKPSPLEEERLLSKKLNCLKSLAYVAFIVNPSWWLALALMAFLVVLARGGFEN